MKNIVGAVWELPAKQHSQSNSGGTFFSYFLKKLYIFSFILVSAIFFQRNYNAKLVGNSLELNKHSSKREAMYYSGMAEQDGTRGTPQDFSRSVNPISTWRRALHIHTCPLQIFRPFRRPWYWITGNSWCHFICMISFGRF